MGQFMKNFFFFLSRVKDHLHVNVIFHTCPPLFRVRDRGVSTLFQHALRQELLNEMSWLFSHGRAFCLPPSTSLSYTWLQAHLTHNCEQTSTHTPTGKHKYNLSLSHIHPHQISASRSDSGALPAISWRFTLCCSFDYWFVSQMSNWPAS